MLKEVYQNDVEILRALNHPRNAIMNIFYKFRNDQNVKVFFNRLTDYILKPESLSWSEKYELENNVTDIKRVLLLIFNTMLNIDLTKHKSSEEIRKKCSIFFDSIGEMLMYSFSHLPLIELLELKLGYIEHLKKYHNTKENFIGGTHEEYKRSLVFDKFAPHFPNDEDFLDYDFRNEHIEVKRKEYEDDGKKEELDNQLIALATVFECAREKDILYTSKVEIGCKYWDLRSNEKQKNDKEMMESLKVVMDGILSASKKENIEK